MCVAVPVKIVEVSGTRAVVDAGGNLVAVDVSMVDDAAAGDWVIVHAGFALQKYSPEEAAETLELFRRLAEGAEEE